ncbi:hypothetical protein J6590_057501 [Homalodisca vitripennis]|nr:hypothetical protein J6590_057501 [Homalodisca vitripennis]
MSKRCRVCFQFLRSSSPTVFESLQTNTTPDFRSEVCDSIRFQMLLVSEMKLNSALELNKPTEEQLALQLYPVSKILRARTTITTSEECGQTAACAVEWGVVGGVSQEPNFNV